LTFDIFDIIVLFKDYKDGIKIIKSKISSSQKKDLKVLVESFLEVDRSDILQLYQSSPTESRVLFERLYWILMKNTLPDEYSTATDLTDEELKKEIIEAHRLLTPLWKKFKKALFNFKEEILPERKKIEAADETLNDPSSPLHIYKDLQAYGYISRDKFYPIKLSSVSKTINLSFDNGKVNVFRRELNAVNSFIDIINGAPIDLFARCGHCKKVIFISRKGKKYHSGCAAKAIQKEFWKKNKKMAREKERLRYQRRKIKKLSDFD